METGVIMCYIQIKTITKGRYSMSTTAITRLTDVIVPSVFAPYVIKATMEQSELIKSGIVANAPEFDRL